MEKTKKMMFHTIPNPPPVKPSKCGGKIYKWNYIDEKGELRTDESNVHEKIQSFRRQTDYKQRIKIGESVYDNPSANYMDISGISDSANGIHDYIAGLAKAVQEAYQSQKTAQAPKETGPQEPKDLPEVGTNQPPAVPVEPIPSPTPTTGEQQ